MTRISCSMLSHDVLDVVGTEGCWVAFYHDRSGIYLFASELEALRFAVTNSCVVAFRHWGEEAVSGGGGMEEPQ